MAQGHFSDKTREKVVAAFAIWEKVKGWFTSQQMQGQQPQQLHRV